MIVSETINQDKKRFHLENDTISNTIQVVYNTHRVLSDYYTLPYGYKLAQGFDSRQQHPFSLVVSGPSKCGKTYISQECY